MMFSRVVRDRVAHGEATVSIRLWSRPQVKVVAPTAVPALSSRSTPSSFCSSKAVTDDDVVASGETDPEALRHRTAHSGPIGDDTLVFGILLHVVWRLAAEALKRLGHRGSRNGLCGADESRAVAWSIPSRGQRDDGGRPSTRGTKDAETISIRGRRAPQNRRAELAGPDTPHRRQRLRHPVDAGLPAAAAGARTRAGHRRGSERPARRHVGVCLAAAAGLADGVGGALPVTAHRWPLRAGHRVRPTGDRGRAAREGAARPLSEPAACRRPRERSGSCATSTARCVTRLWRWPSVAGGPWRSRPRSRTR